jgi:hypothetical protein
VLLLAMRLVTTNQLDLWAMIKRWNRRRRYRDVVAGGYDPFSGTGGGRPAEGGDVEKTLADKQKDADALELRGAISRRFDEHNLAAAADLYLQLMHIDSEQILPRQHLLDIANQLASSQRASEAAWAYSQFLAHYGNYQHAEQVELMLGLLFSRYLSRPKEAIEHLQRAVERLSDPAQLRMCREELAKLQS